MGAGLRESVHVSVSTCAILTNGRAEIRYYVRAKRRKRRVKDTG